MKKIIFKITSLYNRYIGKIFKKIIFFIINSKFIENKKNQISVYKRYLSKIFKKIILFIIHLKFIENKKIKISVFNRYLILLIVFLFSYLFYLSIPTLYNQGDLQKFLTEKLKKEFNLNTALSAKINYKILPSPNFEVSDVLLNMKIDNKLNDYAQIKKMKIFVSVKNLQNQKKLRIKNIVISEANFNIRKDSFNFINNYLKNEISSKKIKIKKSNIFFREKNSEKNILALATINKGNLFYNDKKNNIEMHMEGTIFNTNYDLILSRNIYKKNETEVRIKLNKLNTLLKNMIEKNNDNINGNTFVKFSGSEINIKYNIDNKIMKLHSDNSKLNNKNIDFNGNLSFSPFYYDLNINLKNIDELKLINNLSKIKNLIGEKFLLNKNLNGNIEFNIKSLKNIKIFNNAKVILTTRNGKLIFNNSKINVNKIGKISLIDSTIELKDNKKILKSKLLFEIVDQKKFYQKFQISKSSRIKLDNIYFELEKDLDLDRVNVSKLLVNKNILDDSSKNEKDFTNLIDLEEINKIKNWIELKKFSRNIFSEIKKIN